MRLRLPGRSNTPAGTGTGASPATADEATGGSRKKPAETTTAPAPAEGRGPKMAAATQKLAVASARLLIIVAAIVVIGYVLGKLWVILLPIVLGLLIATVLWPATRFLRNHRWPAALAASTVLLGFLAGLVGVVAAIAPSVADQAGELADQSTAALDDVQEWLGGPPFNLDQNTIGEYVDSAINSLQENAQSIAGYGLTIASGIGNGLLNLLLALLLCFFFLKDGPRWVPWLSAQTGHRAARHVAALSYKTWATLSEFIRQQALVGFIDAVFIGVGLWALGVPLVLPLAVLTFFGGFVPIIGAFVAGAFAVLIALVSVGFTKALIVLGLVVLVQQIEGNVLQPIIQGRGFNLHAAVVILAVTAGGSLFGITGAFLGVPVAAIVAVIYRYVRDELDDRSPDVQDDGTRARVTGDAAGAEIVHDQVAPPAGPTDRPES